MLVPLNSSVSFVGGSALAWAIIGPALVASNVAFGIPATATGKFPEYLNYANMVLDDPVNAPSPKYWMIWPGCAVLLCSSFAEIVANGGAVFRSLSVGMGPTAEAVKRFVLGRRRRDLDKSDKPMVDEFPDPAPLEEQTPWWMWISGLTIGSIITIVIMRYQFGQNAGVTILAILISFIFSLIGAECAGRISVIPVTTFGNFAQLVFGGVSKGMGVAPAANQLNNGLTGMITLAVSEQAADMLGKSTQTT